MSSGDFGWTQPWGSFGAATVSFVQSLINAGVLWSWADNDDYLCSWPDGDDELTEWTES
jgi:hypothetical protein